MMEKYYILRLNDNNRIRIHLLTERGKLQKVLCQYETILRDTWTPIARYDSAHGFFHKDVLYRDGTKEKRALNYVDLDSAFKYAVDDLKNNWESYLDRYNTQKWR